MIRLAFLFAVTALPALAAGQSFEQSSRGFLWKQGPHWVRFDKGNWSAGRDDGGSISWTTFLWHDQYVYESLSGGKITAGPSVEADGTLTMEGTFSARNDSAPMHYAYRIRPTAEGVQVRCVLRKSGPLKLSRGVWLHVRGQREKLRDDYRVWLEPSAFSTLGAAFNGAGRRLHVELTPGKAIVLGSAGVHELESESPINYLYRFSVLSDDFDVGQDAVIEHTIGFGDLPPTLPGQIEKSARPLELGRVAASAATLPCYEKLELTVDASAAYDNPFDPDQVRLDAEFTTPAGKRLVVPGFFMVAFERQTQARGELLVPLDRGAWRVRFTPRESGPHTWRLTLTDRSGQKVGGAGKFTATAARSPGFVRPSPADPHYFAFDNGQGYFPIGHNLPIYHTRGELGDEAMRKFAAAGENFNRWWMNSSGFGIEWCRQLGWYRQDAAARLDLVLDQAPELGMYYMLCMDTHQDFRDPGWSRNPFNAQNGGPCAAPADWFTNEAAKKFYRQRLRYTIARWGYSPHVLCWEFGNEMEGWEKSPDAIKLPWHREMAAYLRRNDPFGHMITTSFWTNTGPEEYWRLDDFDIVQTHLYTNNDAGVSAQVRECCLRQWQRYAKPHIFAEFGIRSKAGTEQKDPQGWAVHNALWTGLTSLASGGPMPWWHESYIDKLDLYFHFTALSRFVADLPWGQVRWQPVDVQTPEFLRRDRPPVLRDAILAPAGNGWTKVEQPEFTLRADGSLGDGVVTPPLLHGDGHRDLRVPLTFTAHYPQPGKFIVRVGRVSAGARLNVWIDDRLALDQDLPCGEGVGKDSDYRPKWKLWESTYDQDFAVDVPAGRHRIRIVNAGRDWMTVGRYVFTGCQVLDRPHVSISGITGGSVAVLWLQNRDSTWYNHAGGGPVPPVEAFRCTLQGLPDGDYTVQWWETWKGRVTRTTPARVAGGQLTLEIPELATDVALKLRRQ